MLYIKYKLAWLLMPVVIIIGILNLMILSVEKANLVNLIILCLYWLSMTIYAHHKERRKKEDENS